MAKSTVSIVSFNSAAAAIAKAYASFDRAAGKLTATVNQTMQGYIDAWMVKNGKDEASIKALGKEIRESEVVLNLVAKGAMEKKTFTEYAQSAMRAAYWNLPFEASLKNNPELALPWSKKSTGGDGKKSGGVQTTDRAALDATLCKAIKQARLLKLEGFAADLLDLAMDALADFKEITEQ